MMPHQPICKSQPTSNHLLAALLLAALLILPWQARAEQNSHRFNLFYSGNLIGESDPCG